MTEPIRESRKTEGPWEGGTLEEHPAFGMISISRCSGDAELFNSEGTHQHFVSLRIHGAELHYDHHSERPMQTKRLAEVWMTEAQYAQMLTTMNVGEGTPCTIRQLGNQRFDLPPRGKKVIERFHDDLDQRLASVRREVAEAIAAVEEMRAGTVKTNKGTLTDLEKKLLNTQRTLTGNLDYIETCLKERMEKVVTDARIEFEAQVNLSLERRGLLELTGRVPQLKDGGQ